LIESLGLKIVKVTDSKTLDMIRTKAQEHKHRVMSVYSIVNETTQKAFDAQLAKAANKYTELFWHGSGNKNWWFIVQQGLRIRPSGAVIAGAMFGHGIYAASECDKSMGYTDSGRWRGGRSDGRVYMALYDMHLGKQMVIERHDSSCYDLHQVCNKKGYDSVWAKKGVSLYRHEYIIYRPEQCTIKYLIEFKD
jgi:poly [ADP-ribose] polymerase